jgi:excisionase family DNA binding protein
MSVCQEVAMRTRVPASDTRYPPIGTAMIPTAHDMQLAAKSRLTLGSLARTSDDVTFTVAGEGGVTTELRIPSSAVQLLFAALSEMASGNAVSLLPLQAELTTQQAADSLNVSRPYVVGLLEKGEMPFRLVGNQRRVRLQDIMAYKARTDIDRRAALNELARLGQEVGVGYEV